MDRHDGDGAHWRRIQSTNGFRFHASRFKLQGWIAIIGWKERDCLDHVSSPGPLSAWFQRGRKTAPSQVSSLIVIENWIRSGYGQGLCFCAPSLSFQTYPGVPWRGIMMPSDPTPWVLPPRSCLIPRDLVSCRLIFSNNVYESRHQRSASSTFGMREIDVFEKRWISSTLERTSMGLSPPLPLGSFSSIERAERFF